MQGILAARTPITVPFLLSTGLDIKCPSIPVVAPTAKQEPSLLITCESRFKVRPETIIFGHKRQVTRMLTIGRCSRDPSGIHKVNRFQTRGRGIPL